MKDQTILHLQKLAYRKKHIKRGFRFLLNLIIALFLLFPLMYAVSIAFMPAGDLFTMELNLIPSNPTLDNFRCAFSTIPLFRFIINSFLVSSCITIGQIITCSLAAFCFSFFNFKGKSILFILVIATMMVPSEATILSNYLTVCQLGMLDSYPVLILPFLTSAMGIFLFRQFYMTFPISL